jgi:hypothetical protein
VQWEQYCSKIAESFINLIIAAELHRSVVLQIGAKITVPFDNRTLRAFQNTVDVQLQTEYLQKKESTRHKFIFEEQEWNIRKRILTHKPVHIDSDIFVLNTDIVHHCKRFQRVLSYQLELL